MDIYYIYDDIFMELFRIIWNLLELFRIIWNLLELFGSKFELFGIIKMIFGKSYLNHFQNHFESFGIFWIQ